ncbi:UNVERIFIED_CONTAM: hypothetical protein GTU68_051212 [Idotea baltica]|nr:hypothetical protein [Idotea baltica]
MKFNELQIADVTQETTDCVSVAFEIPPELESAYSFIPGQYLTLEHKVKGEPIRRSYSICSHPTEEMRVAIKQVPDGVFSTFANSELKVGMKLKVATPEGNFIHQAEPGQSNRYVAFVAGSGITPVLSIIKAVLMDEPNSEFILFYGNRRTNNIIFKEEIEGLKNKYMDRLQVYHILSRAKMDAPILSGRIDPANCSKYFKYFIPNHEVDKVFLCGPYDMIMGMKEALLTEGVAADNIKFELFFNPEAEEVGSQPKEKKVVDHERTIKITLDGLTANLKSNFDISILDMAIEAGMDLPYSCKGGVCATCKAKVLDGDVEMKTNFALEEEEVEAGYVLTCQAHAKTDFVHVNFDV